MMVNRRERVRAATVQEIKEVARRQLVTNGPNAVSLRAIAREMGMTAPALYRYFPSFDHLVAALVEDLYGEISNAMNDTRNLAGDEPGVRLFAVCRTFRAWAVGHSAEFGLIFNSSNNQDTKVATSHKPLADTNAAGARFGGIFLGLLADLWQQRPFTVPAPDNLEPGLAGQLTDYREAAKTTLPLGALAVAVSMWMQIYGLVSLEIFGHLPFATDGEAFFEQQLGQFAEALGCTDDYQASRA